MTVGSAVFFFVAVFCVVIIMSEALSKFRIHVVPRTLKNEIKNIFA